MYNIVVNIIPSKKENNRIIPNSKFKIYFCMFFIIKNRISFFIF